MNKSLEEFMDKIRLNPKEIMDSKYDYMAIMFPQEYIKAMKVYIKFLLEEIHIYRIRSKL
jgi:hypothetical protein